MFNIVVKVLSILMVQSSVGRMKTAVKPEWLLYAGAMTPARPTKNTWCVGKLSPVSDIGGVYIYILGAAQICPLQLSRVIKLG